MDTIPDFEVELNRLSGLLDGGLASMREQAAALAEAERAYRFERSEAWTRIPDHVALAAQRGDWVDAATRDARYARDLARDVREAAKEAVRSRRTQISALQSLMSAHREEAGLARFGPEMTP